MQIKQENADAGHDHAAELLQALQEARRHDRHGHDRGERVLEDLQARRGRHPDQQAAARGSTTRDLVYRTEREKWDAIVDEIEEIHADRPADPRSARPTSRRARSSRRCSSGAASSTRCSTPSRRTSAARPRSSPRPAGIGGGDDRHEHGRPRHRHHPRRQPRDAGLGRPQAAEGRGRPAALPDPARSPQRRLDDDGRRDRARRR